jgi:3-oxoacyl-[acyl-carrier-protein] synthase-3
MTTSLARVGVRISGTGSVLPAKTITNADLERMMDTSDEWILQRTGVRERRAISGGESTWRIGADALRLALDDARVHATDLDLILFATMTPEMPCPPCACRVADSLGAGPVGAMDINAACCGFVYCLNIAHELIRGGVHKTVGIIGADTLSTLLDYSNAGRATSIIFGDGAGAAILSADHDDSIGIIAQAMHSNGAGWKDIYVPAVAERDFPEGVEHDDSKLGYVQMNGKSVFKFAVGTFPGLIQETLDKAGLRPEDVDQFVCHQSNARILTAARDRFGLPEKKLYINIDRRGNTVAASVPLCLDELRKEGRITEGQKVMFVAFGAGLTWGSSLWQF